MRLIIIFILMFLFMAVPKKKRSVSIRRIRSSKKKYDILSYKQCKKSLDFLPLHRESCNKLSYVTNIQNKYKLEIL